MGVWHHLFVLGAFASVISLAVISAGGGFDPLLDFLRDAFGIRRR